MINPERLTSTASSIGLVANHERLTTASVQCDSDSEAHQISIHSVNSSVNLSEPAFTTKFSYLNGKTFSSKYSSKVSMDTESLHKSETHLLTSLTSSDSSLNNVHNHVCGAISSFTTNSSNIFIDKNICQSDTDHNNTSTITSNEASLNGCFSTFIFIAILILNLLAYYFLTGTQPWFSSKGLKLGFLNIHHVVPKMDQVRELIQTQNPCILGLSETFLNDNIDDNLLHVANYSLERRDRRGQEGGGVLCFIKNSISYVRRTDLEPDDMEIIWIEIIHEYSKNILVSFIYRTPSTTVDWFPKFSTVLDNIFTENKEVIILGDMNIDLLHHMTHKTNRGQPPHNHKVKKLLQILRDNNLSQIIDKPTRVTQDSKTLIDHIYVSHSSNIIHKSVPTFSVSDHYPVCVTRKISKLKSDSSHTVISYRSTKHFHLDTFMGDLFNAPWNDINKFTSPDDALALWNNIFNTILNKHMPIKQKRVKHQISPPWMNSTIRNAMAFRDKLKKMKNFSLYKIWRNKVCNLIKYAKRNFYINALNKNKRTPKELWNHLKQVCPNKVDKFPSLLLVDDQYINERSEIVDTLNKRYCNIANIYLPNKHFNLHHETTSKISEFVNSKIQTDNKFSIPLVTSEFVRKQLNSMNTSKATGTDGFSASILKLASPAIVASITKICNMSLISGNFPSQWKEARVLPLYKGGNKANSSNYRPISVLPILSKIIEKHVYNSLYDFLQEHNLLLKSQYGFRKNHSCQEALIALTEHIYQSIHDGKFVGVVQLDLSKAFDLVNHRLLLEKLKLYKFDDHSISWFSSYLNDRTQCVYIKETKSSPGQISSGVPQGSILGPLLFLLYINDLPLFVSHCIDLLYADDTTLLSIGQSIKDIELSLTSDVENIERWCNHNDMVLSIPKSSCMLLSTRQKLLHSHEEQSLKIKIGDSKIIPFVENSKILGVHFDQFISWHKQTDSIKSKINKNLYLLKQIKTFLPHVSRVLFYNSYILPTFDYCSLVWGNCSAENLDKLLKLQKKSVRLILDVNHNDYNTRSADLFDKLGWMPLADRINYIRNTQVYKCFKGIAPPDLQKVFTPVTNIHTHNTRSALNNNFHVPGNCHLRSFQYLGIKNWNSLPPAIKEASSLTSFKRLYQKYLS